MLQIYQSKHQPLFLLNITILLTIFLVAGCGIDDSNTSSKLPVPIGDKAALEKLAQSYNKTAEQLQSSPAILPPKSKRKFVEQVFREAGYDYQLTLLNLSGNEMDASIQYHRDLAELVLFPQSGLSYDDYATVFSENETTAVKKLQLKLRSP